MAKRFPLLLIALLIMGFTVAGCGDDDDKASGTSSDTAAQTEAASDTSSDTATTTEPAEDAETTAKTTATTPDLSNEPQVKQAVKQCKQSVNSAPQLKDDTKNKLEDICEKAARGDQSGIKEASKEVCLAIIEDTGIGGSAADSAKKQCEALSK
jgi:FtsZ-interacting cell division protein ZipA